MKTLWMDAAIHYDGSQLRAHWILQQAGLVGDAMVAFRGSCRVSDEEMADLEDLGGPGIAGDDMVHFLWERFDDAPLATSVLRQRLLTCIARDVLVELWPLPAAELGSLRRDGDDLYFGPGKLSISIATKSPVSTLFHFACNVTPNGTPVSTAGLAELGIDPEDFGRRVLERVAAEEESMAVARAKVRAKGEA